MKNKKNLKIILIIILIIIFITILAFAILSNVTTYTATITEMDNNSIIIEDDSRLIPLSLDNMKNPDISKVYGHLVYKGNNAYGTTKERIYLKDVLILDTKCKKISNVNLRTGDKIYIVTLNIGHEDISSVPPILFNVKLIKVLEP